MLKKSIVSPVRGFTFTEALLSLKEVRPGSKQGIKAKFQKGH